MAGNHARSACVMHFSTTILAYYGHRIPRPPTTLCVAIWAGQTGLRELPLNLVVSLNYLVTLQEAILDINKTL